MPRKTYFRDLWLKLPLYKDWLRRKMISLDNAVTVLKTLMFLIWENWLWKAMLGVKNASLDPPQNQAIPWHFLIDVKIKRIKRWVQNSEKDKRENKPLSSGQKTIGNTFIRDNVLFAEIKFALKTVESNYSQRSWENIIELFKVMFTGSIVDNILNLEELNVVIWLLMVKETIFLIFFIQRYNNHVSILFLSTKV